MSYKILVSLLFLKILTSIDVSRKYPWINRGARYLSSIPFTDRYFSSENKIDPATFQKNISRIMPCELIMDILTKTLRGSSNRTRSNRVTRGERNNRSSMNKAEYTAKSL